MCATGSAVEITNQSAENDAVVQIWAKASSGAVMNSQRFRIVQNANGSYRLQSYASNYTKAVVVKNGSTAEGWGIVQYTDNGSTNGHWYFERVETGTCSRAVISIPYSDTYHLAVANSASRFGKMPTAEALLKSEYLGGVALNARAGALALQNIYPLASDMLLHFLDISGATYVVPSDVIMNTLEVRPQINEVLDAINGSYNTLKVENYIISYGKKIVAPYGGSSANTDWRLAINKCDFWGKATASGTSIDQITLQLCDFYDWDADDMSDIFGVAASALNECHYAGIARDFPVTGYAYY